MFRDLKPYDAYRKIGMPWLDVVPAHWAVERVKNVLRPIDVRSEDGNEELLTVSSARGVVLRSSASVSMFQAKSYAGHKLCWPGDLVINSLWAWGRGLGVSRIYGIVSTAYGVYRPREQDSIDAGYLDALARSDAFQWELQVRSRGVWKSRLQLTDDQFLSAPLPLPPAAEQAAIVKYLGHAHARIDRAIAAKRKLIALLEEQKHAIINQAVTRGLDPTVPMKDSGIRWLGAIPAHWELRRAKEVCERIVDCKNRTPRFVDGGAYRVVRTTCIRRGKFSLEGAYATDGSDFAIWTLRGAPRAGDVFFTREAPAGEAALVPDRVDLCMGQRMMYFRPDPALLDPQFLLRSIYGPVVRAYIDVSSNGSTVGHLRLGQVGSLPVLWCPVEEQRTIVDYIDRATAGLDAAAQTAAAGITLLREYRTRLTSDVVTGQLDVRDTAAVLPDFVERVPPDADTTEDESFDELDEALEEADA